MNTQTTLAPSRTSAPVDTFSPGVLLKLLTTAAADAAEIRHQFQLWERELSSLPLMTEDYSFGRNWLNSSKELWETNDGHAAVWQLRQLSRRFQLA